MSEAQQNKLGRLFRFFPEAASDFFTAKKLWFSSAEDFNDLFEVVPRFDSLVGGQLDAETKKRFAFLPPSVGVDWLTYNRIMTRFTSQVYEESMETLPVGIQKKFSKLFGMVCFSENLASLLMWGHYATCHRGFVVEFEPAHQLFHTDDFGKVTYSKHRPHVETRIHRDVLYTKSPEWEYEQEHRLVRPFASLQREKRRDGKEKSFLVLPPDSVRAVYLGCRMLEPHRDELLESLRSPEWKHVARKVMRRHHTDYCVEPIDFEKLRPVPKDAEEDLAKLWPFFGL